MIGGINNFKLAPAKVQMFVIFANYLASMVCSSGAEVKEEQLGKLIYWFLVNNLNPKEVNMKSYALVRFNKLVGNVQKIIESAVNKEEPTGRTAKFLLSTTFAKFKEIDSMLPTLTEKFTRSTLEKNIQRGFNTLAFGLLKNPELSNYFNCELGGFDYTIDSLCSASSTQT
jgi:hypothetical protein